MTFRLIIGFKPLNPNDLRLGKQALDVEKNSLWELGILGDLKARIAAILAQT